MPVFCSFIILTYSVLSISLAGSVCEWSSLRRSSCRWSLVLDDWDPYYVGAGGSLGYVVWRWLLDVHWLLRRHWICHRWHLEELRLRHTNRHICCVVHKAWSSRLTHSSLRHLHGHEHLILVILHQELLLVIHACHRFLLLLQFLCQFSILHFQLVFIDVIFFLGSTMPVLLGFLIGFLILC